MWFSRKSATLGEPTKKSKFRVTSVPTTNNVTVWSLYQLNPYGTWDFRSCTASEAVGQAWIENIRNGGHYEKLEIEG